MQDDQSRAFEPPTRSDPTLGIGLKIVSIGAFLVMGTLLRSVHEAPTGQLVFFRSAFAILPIVAFLAWRHELRAGIRTRRPAAHLFRALVGICGMSLGFFALTRLPLFESVAIGYTMPLLIVVFGAIFLGETVRLYRWTAVLVGLVGVAIIVWPRLTVFANGSSANPDLALGALAALAACVFGAFATLHVRNLIQTERSATIVLYFSVFCTLGGLLTLPFGWIMPSPSQAAMLVGAGIAGGIGQILLTEAFRHADVSVIAPFEYVSLVLSIGIGYVVFGDVPTFGMLVGSVIVVLSGLFILWRERRLGVKRRAKQFVPPTPGGG